MRCEKKQKMLRDMLRRETLRKMSSEMSDKVLLDMMMYKHENMK